MSFFRSVPRVLAAVCFPAAMFMLWLDSIVGGGGSAAWTKPSDVIAAAAAGRFSMTVGAAADFAMAILLGMAALGLVAAVRGRGRSAVIATAALVVVGLPAHVIGGVFALVAVQLTQSGLTPAQQVVAIAPIFNNVGPVYFISLAPFLLSVLVIPAAMWRARFVSWGPLALLAATMAYQVVLGAVVQGSTVLWWAEPAGCVAAYAWLGFGYLRYRAAIASPVAEPLPVAA